MFEKILVPLDGSELAERALAPALALAEQEGGEVVLLQVPIYKQIMVPGTAGYGLLRGSGRLPGGFAGHPQPPGL
jgi:nucleotide-binding universal stress UspA family protein